MIDLLHILLPLLLSALMTGLITYRTARRRKLAREIRRTDTDPIKALEADTLFGKPIADIRRDAEREAERLHWQAFPEQRQLDRRQPAPPEVPKPPPGPGPGGNLGPIITDSRPHPITATAPVSLYDRPGQSMEWALSAAGRCTRCRWHTIARDRALGDPCETMHLVLARPCPDHDLSRALIDTTNRLRAKLDELAPEIGNLDRRGRWFR